MVMASISSFLQDVLCCFASVLCLAVGLQVSCAGVLCRSAVQECCAGVLFIPSDEVFLKSSRDK